MSESEEPLLSAEELSAIEDMVADGKFGSETFGYNPEAEVISIARNEENLGASSIAIAQINERFHRFFRTRLLQDLDYNARLSVAEPKLQLYSDYIHNVISPSSVNVVEMTPLKGEALFVIHPQVVYSCLDNWYGGQLRPLDVGEERGFTPNENAVIDTLCGLIFKSMTDAWAPYCDVNITQMSRDINPLFANIAGDEESVVVNRFELRLPDESVSAYIDAIYTYQSLNLQRDLLRSRMQTHDADQNGASRLQRSLSDVDFKVFVSGGALNISVNELSSLSVGDILSFDPPEKAEVKVNDFPLFSADIGISGSKVAVKLEETILRGEN